ncbi:MAG: hypothetical protein HYX69_19020 [Planctomycetia bacterium]|nr:hypothetical protein [Planctomycetia bacterium]
MSQLESTDRGRAVSTAKPKPDIYTVLLGIALGAILLAILCLVLELGRYGWDYSAEKAKFRGVGAVSSERLPGAISPPTFV